MAFRLPFTAKMGLRHRSPREELSRRSGDYQQVVSARTLSDLVFRPRRGCELRLELLVL
jgi:hypothetical protein